MLIKARTGVTEKSGGTGGLSKRADDRPIHNPAGWWDGRGEYWGSGDVTGVMLWGKEGCCHCSLFGSRPFLRSASIGDGGLKRKAGGLPGHSVEASVKRCADKMMDLGCCRLHKKARRYQNCLLENALGGNNW